MFGQSLQPTHKDNNIPDDDISRAMSDDNQKQVDTSWQHPGRPLEHKDEHQDRSERDGERMVAPDNHSDSHFENHSDNHGGSDQPASDKPADNELFEIKQEALSQLSPLVGHLEQAPEEKFRTTMMMIQASDDPRLVKLAYEAALAIEDEKTRAQALLDVVNEINYFTQPHHD